MIDAIMFGGEEGRHLERIQAQSEAQGVRILWHVAGRGVNRAPPLPKEARLVLILKSHVGHPLAEAARAKAKEAGIPFLYVNSAGFQSDLAMGLARIKLTPTFGTAYGADSRTPPPGHWEWTGTTWEWRSLRALPPPPPAPGNDSLGSLLLAVGTGLLLRLRRRR